MKILISISKDWDDYFDSNVLAEARKINDKFKSREYLVYMPIDVFLKLAEKAPYPKSLPEEILVQGKKWDDIPFLLVNYKEGDTEAFVVGHEGRNRARVLKEHGFSTMPVILKTDSIRWSQQTNPATFDYLKTWPKLLVAEKRDFSIPFPIIRKNNHLYVNF